MRQSIDWEHIMSEPIKIELSIRWSEEQIQNEVVESLTNYFRGRIGAEIEKTVRASIETAIAKQAETAVADYLARPIQQTDQWGQPKPGGATTMAEFVSKKFEERMAERVDAYGGRGGREQQTRLDWLVKTITTEKLEARVKATIEEARKKSEAAMKAAIADLMAKHLSKHTA